jgi:hypothetical protein
MTPFELPGGHWLDLEHVQSVTGVTQSEIDNNYYFAITLIWQPHPLIIDAALDETGQPCVKELQLLHARFVHAWSGLVPNTVLSVDAATIQDLVVHDTDAEGNTLVDLSYVVGNTPSDQQLLSLLRQHFDSARPADPTGEQHEPGL